MSTQPSIEVGRQALHLPLRQISVSTVYAWTRVIEAYGKRHPDHEVRVFYHRNQVQDLKLLVRHSPLLDPNGFAVQVQAQQVEQQEVLRLVSLLEQATGPDLQKFLTADDPNVWFAQPAPNGHSA